MRKSRWLSSSPERLGTRVRLLLRGSPRRFPLKTRLLHVLVYVRHAHLHSRRVLRLQAVYSRRQCRHLSRSQENVEVRWEEEWMTRPKPPDGGWRKIERQIYRKPQIFVFSTAWSARFAPRFRFIFCFSSGIFTTPEFFGACLGDNEVF